MTGTEARRMPQKSPAELRERMLRMEVRHETGEQHGVITRVAHGLGVGAESLQRVKQAEVNLCRWLGTPSADAPRIAQPDRRGAW